jgi:hypothetical protein
MDDDAAESMSHQELLGQVRAFRDQLRPRADYLRELGFAVDSVLAECDGLIAFLEGGSEAGPDIAGLCAKLAAFHSELRGFAGLERQAERAKAIGSIPGLLDAVEDLAQRLSRPEDARTATSLQAEVEAARQRLARGEVPVEEMADLSLSTNAQAAELSRRCHFQAAALALFWESRPPEWWAGVPAEQRQKLEEFLGSWRAEREKILGELPIADRRRLEALRPEDFDQPGALEP